VSDHPGKVAKTVRLSRDKFLAFFALMALLGQRSEAGRGSVL
jgi:hypothetical protein